MIPKQIARFPSAGVFACDSSYRKRSRSVRPTRQYTQRNVSTNIMFDQNHQNETSQTNNNTNKNMNTSLSEVVRPILKAKSHLEACDGVKPGFEENNTQSECNQHAVTVFSNRSYQDLKVAGSLASIRFNHGRTV
jgi:hypothetical protein